jgi:hypothetical protein
MVTNKLKKYGIQWDDETLTMSRINDGFSPIELIGILTLAIKSIEEQMLGKDTTPITTIKTIVK